MLLNPCVCDTAAIEAQVLNEHTLILGTEVYGDTVSSGDMQAFTFGKGMRILTEQKDLSVIFVLELSPEYLLTHQR